MTECEEKVWAARPRLYGLVNEYILQLAARTGISPQSLVNLALIYAMQHQDAWLPELPFPQTHEVS